MRRTILPYNHSLSGSLTVKNQPLAFYYVKQGIKTLLEVVLLLEKDLIKMYYALYAKVKLCLVLFNLYIVRHLSSFGNFHFCRSLNER